MKIALISTLLTVIYCMFGASSAEIVLLRNGQKYEGEVITPFNKGILFREEEGTPGRYYAYDEINRIITEDGLLYYLMPRHPKMEKKKRKDYLFFPFAKMLMKEKTPRAPMPYITLPRGDSVPVSCAGAIDPVTIETGDGVQIHLLGCSPPPEDAGENVFNSATEFLEEKVAGKKASLFPGPQLPGEPDTVSAYVTMESTFVNAECIEHGWARAFDTPAAYLYRNAFFSLQKHAQNLERGLWK